MAKPIASTNIYRIVLFAVLASALLSACATTQEARSVQKTGFLGDYSKLEQPRDRQALHVYWNPNADFSSYNRLILDKVDVWCCDEDSKLKNVSQEDLRSLSNAFYQNLKGQLGREYELTQEPGPGVMRLQVMLTEASKSFIPLDVLSTVYPSARVLSALKKLATGTEAFVGSASIEVRLTDSMSGDVLFEQMDRRAGGKSVKKWSTDPWHDVKLNFEYWAENFARDFHGKRTSEQPVVRGPGSEEEKKLPS